MPQRVSLPWGVSDILMDIFFIFEILEICVKKEIFRSLEKCVSKNNYANFIQCRNYTYYTYMIERRLRRTKNALIFMWYYPVLESCSLYLVLLYPGIIFRGDSIINGGKGFRRFRVGIRPLAADKT